MWFGKAEIGKGQIMEILEKIKKKVIVLRNDIIRYTFLKDISD